MRNWFSLLGVFLGWVAACSPTSNGTNPASPATSGPATSATVSKPAVSAAATASSPVVATSASPPDNATADKTVAKLDEVCRQGSRSPAIPAVERGCASGLVCCTQPQGINAPQVAFCRVPCKDTASGGPTGCRGGCAWALVP